MSVAAIPRNQGGLDPQRKRPPGPGPWDVRDLPWWTAADRAEYEVLCRALFMGIDWHLERCPVAKQAEQDGYGLWCRHLSGAVEEVVEWREMREAYSRAVYLRNLLGADGSGR